MDFQRWKLVLNSGHGEDIFEFYFFANEKKRWSMRNTATNMSRTQPKHQNCSKNSTG